MEHKIESAEGFELLQELLNKSVYHLYSRSGTYYPDTREFNFESFIGIKFFYTQHDIILKWDLLELNDGNFITRSIITKKIATDTTSVDNTKTFSGFLKIDLQIFKIEKIRLYKFFRNDEESETNKVLDHNEYALLLCSKDKQIFFYPGSFTESLTVVFEAYKIRSLLMKEDWFCLLRELMAEN